MTLALRIVLIVVSFLTLIFIVRSIRNAKVKIEDSVLWFCFAGLLLIASIFPGIFYWLASVTGVQTTSNFVFLFFIFVLLVLCFRCSMRISQADTRIKELTQQLAVEKFERYKNDKDSKSVEAGKKASANEVDAKDIEGVLDDEIDQDGVSDEHAQK